MSSMKVIQFSRPLTPPCLSTSKVLPPQLSLDVQFQTTPPLHPTSPIDNQSIKGKHNPRMTITCYSFRSAFVFIINLLILSGFLNIFSFSQGLTICFFVALCCNLCSFPKISYHLFMIYILVPLLRSTSFIYRIWKCKQTMKQQPHHACERNKYKNKMSHVKLTTRSVVQFSPPTMQWY